MKRTLVVLGVAVVCSLSAQDASAKVTIVNASPRVMQNVPAQRNVSTEAVSKERWVGARAIVRDANSGKLRKPTAKETADLVKTIKQLTARPSVRTESAGPGGVIEPGAMQVIISRATEDGGTETMCVGSFEEAAEFLGLVQQSNNGGQQ